MFFILLIYVISAISWGLIFLQLTKSIISTVKNGVNRPPLLVPLTIASLALFLESLYFGASAIFFFTGNNELFLGTLQVDNWFLIKVLIAVSGVLLLFNLKVDEK